MRFPGELLPTYITAIEHLCRHVYHLNVHFQNVWILQQIDNCTYQNFSAIRPGLIYEEWPFLSDKYGTE